MRKYSIFVMGIVGGILFTVLGVCLVVLFNKETLPENGRVCTDMVIRSFCGKGFGQLITVEGNLAKISSSKNSEEYQYVLAPTQVDGEPFKGKKRISVDFFTGNIAREAHTLESNNVVRVLGYETFSACGFPSSAAEYVDVPQMMGGWGVKQYIVIVKFVPATE